MRTDGFKKEYMAGRRDQFDYDLNTFYEAVSRTKTREELIQDFKNEMSYIVAKLARDRAKTLKDELNNSED
jgi:hypothetical protein